MSEEEARILAAEFAHHRYWKVNGVIANGADTWWLFLIHHKSKFRLRILTHVPDARAIDALNSDGRAISDLIGDGVELELPRE